MGDRLTQSMYVRSDSQSSGVSFFVDFSDKDKEAEKSKKMVHSMSREEADHALDELSEDMRLKSSLLLAQNLEQTKAFFKKLKGYVDFLSLPSYSKDELRQKRKMAENISRLMFEEEQKLKKGQSLSSMGELDKILLGKHFLNLHKKSTKNKSFFNTNYVMIIFFLLFPLNFFIIMFPTKNNFIFFFLLLFFPQKIILLLFFC